MLTINRSLRIIQIVRDKMFKQFLEEALMSNKAPLIRYDVLKNIIYDYVDQYAVDHSPFKLIDNNDRCYDIADRAYDGCGDNDALNLTEKQISMYEYWFTNTPKARVISYVKRVVKEYITRARVTPEMYEGEDEEY